METPPPMPWAGCPPPPPTTQWVGYTPSFGLMVRVWVKPEDYWGVYFHMHEQVKLTFDREGISIPFPQRDVHMIPTSKTA